MSRPADGVESRGDEVVGKVKTPLQAAAAGACAPAAGRPRVGASSADSPSTFAAETAFCVSLGWGYLVWRDTMSS